MTDLELLIDFHLDAERQGPGSINDTLTAMQWLSLPKGQPLKIADIGCGTGAQTIVLAERLAGEVIAVDIFPEFLNKLKLKAKSKTLSAQITIRQESMDRLSFKDNELDIIWSEGAIYNMGFREGVKQWKSYLKPGGYLAVSEITWLTKTRPAEIEAHWSSEYPEIDIASAKIKILEDNGFSLVGYFALSEKSWLENYYTPMEDRFESFLSRHKNESAAMQLVETERHEMDLYKKYRDFVSYGFYVARKERS